ncbi:MAG: ATPase [Chloroflexi bacterium]|nr:ATPase [Chloroflexota bacterium]
MRYVIGLDAGGTKTIAVVMDEARRECGRGASGPGNYHSVGQAGALAAIRHAVGAALMQAGLAVEQVGAGCFALSGVGRPEDQQIGKGFADAVLPGVPTVVCNDAIAALYSGAGKPEGIVMIAGTGSIVYGFASDGRKARAGGWGYRLGDEGSGWWIAEQALFAVTRAHDGRAPATDLTARLLARLGLSRPEDLITWAYSPAWTRDQVAALAPLALSAAEAGDAVAAGIVGEGVRALALCVRVVAERLGLDSAPYAVVLSGSLFRAALYEDLMRGALAEQAARAMPVVPAVDAATGAAWLALDALNGQRRLWIE